MSLTLFLGIPTVLLVAVALVSYRKETKDARILREINGREFEKIMALQNKHDMLLERLENLGVKIIPFLSGREVTLAEYREINNGRRAFLEKMVSDNKVHCFCTAKTIRSQLDNDKWFSRLKGDIVRIAKLFPPREHFDLFFELSDLGPYFQLRNLAK